MVVTKRSISFQPEVWDEVARIAGEGHGPVSTLVNEALIHYLQIRRGLAAVREWESEYGALTADELAEADRTLDQAGVAFAPRNTG
jgi:hypothetical protein